MTQTLIRGDRKGRAFKYPLLLIKGLMRNNLDGTSLVAFIVTDSSLGSTYHSIYSGPHIQMQGPSIIEEWGGEDQ